MRDQTERHDFPSNPEKVIGERLDRLDGHDHQMVRVFKTSSCRRLENGRIFDWDACVKQVVAQNWHQTHTMMRPRTPRAALRLRRLWTNISHASGSGSFQDRQRAIGFVVRVGLPEVEAVEVTVNDDNVDNRAITGKFCMTSTRA